MHNVGDVLTEPLSQSIAPKATNRFLVRLYGTSSMKDTGINLTADILFSTSSANIII